MSKLEKGMIGFFFGGIIVILSFLLGWFLSYGLCVMFHLPESIITLGGTVGMGVGFVLDFIFLKKIVAQGYNLHPGVWIGAYFILSLLIFGFFMGVPVFNIFAGILAGIYTGRKMKFQRTTGPEFKRKLRHACFFTSGVILLVCIASAMLALSDQHTAANLQGMLKLKEVTPAMIRDLILYGGIGTIIVQYATTWFAGKWAYALK
ncbi:MAG: hypothetical protein K6U80_08170 [Firmicutes bacterium]|nr:hypothetical protein [Bacillota bacterium]